MKFNYEIKAVISLPFTVEAETPAEAEELATLFFEESNGLYEDMRKFATFDDCNLERLEYDPKTDFKLKNYSVCLK